MSKPITLDEFIRRSIVKHGHKYDYSKVKYKNQYDMVDIICPIHGEFSQMVKSHMNGSSCRKCSQVEVAKKLKGVKKVNLLDKETIINRLMNIYDYDYSECDIKGTRNNAIISNVKCPIHGYFTKRLSNHLRLKQGCNLCGTNKSNITDFILNLLIP